MQILRNNQIPSAVLDRMQNCKAGMQTALTTARGLDNSSADKSAAVGELNVDNVNIAGLGHFDNLDGVLATDQRRWEDHSLTRKNENGSTSEVHIKVMGDRVGDQDFHMSGTENVGTVNQKETWSFQMISDGRTQYRESAGGTLFILEEPPAPV